MGKRDGQLLAVAHFAVTELRPLWLLWYTVYNTFENIVTSASVSDAHYNADILNCLYVGKMKARDIEKCAKSAYKRYLTHGPQFPYKECKADCPGSGVGIDVPEPRRMFFFMTVWLFGTLILITISNIEFDPHRTWGYIEVQHLFNSVSLCEFKGHVCFGCRGDGGGCTGVITSK